MMRLRETYSSIERRNMLKGTPISFMKYIFNVKDAFYNNIFSVFNGYFMRSNNKRVSPIYEAYLEDDYFEDTDILFLPYHIVEDSGEVVEDNNANITPFLIAEDYSYISVSSSLTVYQYNCRWFCYDVHGNYLGYVSNNFYNLSTLKDRIKGTYFVRFAVIEIEDNTASYVPFSILNNRTNGVILDITRRTPYNMEHLGTLIRNTFIDKWTRMYEALSVKYNPINSITIHESTSGADNEVKTGSKTEANSVESDDTSTLSFTGRKDTDTLTFKDRKDEEHLNYKDDKQGNSKTTDDVSKTNTIDSTDTLSFDNRNDQEHYNYKDEKTETSVGGDSSQVDYGSNETNSLTFNNRNDQSKETRGEETGYTYGFNSRLPVASDLKTYTPTEEGAGYINSSLQKFGSEVNAISKGGMDFTKNNHNNTDTELGIGYKNKEFAKYGSEINSLDKTDTETSFTEKHNWDNQIDVGEENKQVSKYGQEINTKEKIGTEKTTDTKTVNENRITSASDNINNEYEKTFDKTGSDRPIAENIVIELDLRDKNILISTIYSDIDSIITLPIY